MKSCLTLIVNLLKDSRFFVISQPKNHGPGSLQECIEQSGGSKILECQIEKIYSKRIFASKDTTPVIQEAQI